MAQKTSPESNSLEIRGADLASQISRLLTTSPTASLLDEVESLIGKYTPKNNLPELSHVGIEQDDQVERVQFKPKQYTWFGKFPVNNGSTDWYGFKSPLTSGPESRLKQLANMPIKPYETIPRLPSQLQRTAIGIIAPGIKSISFFTQMREDTIGSVVEGLQGAGVMHREAYILESIDYGQRTSETLELIEKGYAWLDPIRKQRLVVPTTYIPRINPFAANMIEQVFEVVPYEMPRDNSTTRVNEELMKLLNYGETTIRTTPGVVNDKQFWLPNTLLIAKVLESLKESEHDWPPTNKPVVVYAELGKDANDQYHHAVDLVEIISILRNSPIRAWATSQVTSEAMHDHIPSLIIVDPRTCDTRHLANIKNGQVIDNSGDASISSPERVATFEKVIKNYVRGAGKLEEVRQNYLAIQH